MQQMPSSSRPLLPSSCSTTPRQKQRGMAVALRARAGAKAGRNLAAYLQGPAPRGRPVRPPVRGVMAAAAGADAVKGLVSKCVAEQRGGGAGESPQGRALT